MNRIACIKKRIRENFWPSPTSGSILTKSWTLKIWKISSKQSWTKPMTLKQKRKSSNCNSTGASRKLWVKKNIQKLSLDKKGIKLFLLSRTKSSSTFQNLATVVKDLEVCMNKWLTKPKTLNSTGLTTTPTKLQDWKIIIRHRFLSCIKKDIPPFRGTTKCHILQKPYLTVS